MDTTSDEYKGCFCDKCGEEGFVFQLILCSRCKTVFKFRCGMEQMMTTKEVKTSQSAWCEICEITCTTKDVLEKHKAGKKRKKNLKKLEQQPKPFADATSMNPSSSSVEVKQSNIAASSFPAEEVDNVLETKKRKLVEEGATKHSVRVCRICNVVVNSETSLCQHFAGQKHVSKLLKGSDRNRS